MTGLLSYIHDRQKDLSGKREVLKTYLIDCFAEADWHGVQDAASDLREIDREHTALTRVEEEHGE